MLYTSQADIGLGVGSFPLARAADGTGTAERLAEFDAAAYVLVATTITPDGAHLVGWSPSGPSTRNDLMLVNLTIVVIQNWIEELKELPRD